MPTALHSAADNDIPLTLTDKPIPFDRTLSFYDVLSHQEQYKHDAKRLAEIAECAHILSNNAQHKIDVSRSEEERAIICHLASFCSSPLSYHCCRIFQKEMPLSEKEKGALALLIQRSKTTVDCLLEDARAALCLSECEDYECPASRSRFPNVRGFMALQITRKESLRTPDAPYTCCFFPSGYLAQEYTLLQTLAQEVKGFAVQNVVIIDANYFQLLSAFGATEKGLVLISQDRLYKSNTVYNEIFSRLSRRGIDIAFHAILKLYSNLGAIAQFKNAIQKLFPTFERLIVYSQAQQYISACTADPAACSDLLIGSDFKDECAPNFKTDSWETLWHDFHKVQQTCVKECGIAWRLTTNAPAMTYLKIFDRSETHEWQHEIISDGPLNPECGIWSTLS